MIISSRTLRALIATLVAAGLVLALMMASGASVASAGAPEAQAASHKGKRCSPKPRKGYRPIRHGGKTFYCKKR